MFYPNGMYIQDLSNDVADFLENGRFTFADKTYNGVARYIHFPLLRIKDPESETVSRKMYEGEHSIYNDCKSDDIIPLLVITNAEYYKEYINRCNELGIKTRTYFIESIRKYPLWQSDLPELKTIGYEIINPNLCEEGLCWLLNTEPYKCFAEKLNEYGLFDDYETAKFCFDRMSENDRFIVEDEDALIARISILADDE